ncbi:MAG: TetR/AcrR family transcriptional regulator [Roseibium sp.]
MSRATETPKPQKKKQAPGPKTARGEATRKAILAAAKRVIGADGYNDASISQITSKAGVAQGTFYIYFNSKEEVFSELVLDLGREIRHITSEAIENVHDRLEAEKAGLTAFLRFARSQPEFYRIVQEAQFVDPAAYREYHLRFEEGYRNRLNAAVQAGQISEGDAKNRAWLLIGIARSLAEQLVVFDTQTSIPELVDNAYDLITHGLRP